MPIYMKYDGVKGSVTAEGYKEWIELQSCSMGGQRLIASGSGRGANREASAPSMGEVTVTKLYDCASVDLFEAFIHGEGKKATICTVKTDKDKLEKVHEFELEDVLVSSYNLSTHGGDMHHAPSETMHLSYLKITFKGTKMDNKNATSQSKLVGFDVAKMKKA